MDTRILITEKGKRRYTSVKGTATVLPGIHRTPFYRRNTRGNGESLYSLTHVLTGRSLNECPLTHNECLAFIDALFECPIEWDKLDDDVASREMFYVNRLTDEAMRIARGDGDHA